MELVCSSSSFIVGPLTRRSVYPCTTTRLGIQSSRGRVERESQKGARGLACTPEWSDGKEQGQQQVSVWHIPMLTHWQVNSICFISQIWTIITALKGFNVDQRLTHYYYDFCTCSYQIYFYTDMLQTQSFRVQKDILSCFFGVTASRDQMFCWSKEKCTDEFMIHSI